MDDAATADTDLLAREALDELPSNVAVLDADGGIVFTNRSWREFAVEGGADPDALPANYLAVADRADDEHADAATEGIRAVLAGDRDVFTHEYPCHSPDEKRWFLMRATRFDLAGDAYAVVAHVDITDRKLAELTADRRADELRAERRALAHLLDRINGLVADVTEAVVRAGSRRDVEAAACRTLAAADPYTLAWIGAPDVGDRRLVTRAWAGAPTSLDVELELGGGEQSPVVAAAEDGSLHAASGDGGWPLDEPWCASVVAVPLSYRDTRYGVLAVCAADPDAFDDRERAVLGALGRVVGTAVNARESTELLTATRVVQAEYAVADPSFPLNQVSRDAGVHLDYEGSVYHDDGTLRVFLTGDGDSDAALAAARDADGVADATVVADYGDEYLLELALDDPVVVRLADHGARTTGVTVRDGVTRLVVVHPHEANARSAFDLLADRFDGVELRSYRETDPPTRTRRALADELESRLTDRQLTALRTAYHAGYFDRPRPVSGDDLADAMGISRSTFHQHLQVAQRKLLAEVFDGD